MSYFRDVNGRVVARLVRVAHDPRVASYLPPGSWIAKTLGVLHRCEQAAGATAQAAWLTLAHQLHEPLEPFDPDTRAALDAEGPLPDPYPSAEE